MKKIVCLVLSLIIIFGIASSVSAGVIVNPGYHATYDEASLDQAIPGNPTAKGRCGEDVYWGYYEDTKTLVINGKGAISLGAWINEPTYSVYEFEKAIVGEGITTLGGNVFARCRTLKEISLPESLEEIRDYVFFECEELQSINIPKNVKIIGLGLFAYCDNLTRITVSPENTVFDSRYNCNAIVRTSNNTIVNGCKTTTIPYTVTGVGAMAFMNCESMEAIRLYGNVQRVDNMAFEGCINLKKINVYNPEITIADVMGSAIPSTTTIYGYKDSTIETYAKNNKKIFKSLSGKYIPMGDADIDSKITVLDATAIQRYVAQLIDFTTSQTRCADMDGDWKVTVIDSTAIQRKLALLE